MKPTTDPAMTPVGWPMTLIGETADMGLSAATGEHAATRQGAQLSLAMARAGDRVWVVEIRGGRRMVRRLTDLGIVQGMEITVVNRPENGAVILGLPGCRIGIGAGMAHRVMVATVRQQVAPLTASQSPTPDAVQLLPDTTENADMTTKTLTLGALEVGQSGRILGYEPGDRAYRGKLLSLGLTPGTQFTVTRQAPLGDPVEITVRGFKLSLRKGEAAALKVEAMAE